MRKNQHVSRLRFSLDTNRHMYPKKLSTQDRLFASMTPSFCSFTDTKQSLQYTIKTNQSGPQLPRFEAYTIYIPQSPPSSMNQSNKSFTVKFHMELLLIYYDPEAISQWCDTKYRLNQLMQLVYRKF